CNPDEAARLSIGPPYLNNFSFETLQLHNNFIYDHHCTALNTPIGPKVVKMEQVPTASPAEEKQPVRPLKNGYLNDVFSIFKARQHPFILLEESALRWMGLR